MIAHHQRFSCLLVFVLLLLAAAAPAQANLPPTLNGEDRTLQACLPTTWDDPTARPATYSDYLRARAQAGNGLDAPFATQLAYRSPAPLYATGKRLDLLLWHTLVTPLATRLKEYRQDLEQEGWALSIWSCTGGTPPEVRSFLLGRHTTDSMVGAVIIGDLPVPWFEMDDDFNNRHSEFPCDLYYMDLDGTWGDKDLDGKFDSHSGTTQPDVFIGRLVAGTLAGTHGTEVSLLNNYFRKAHAYRHGGLTAPSRALSFVDDDWYYKDTGQQNAFDPVVSVTDKATTTAANYRKRLAEGYMSVVLCAHSSPSGSSFKVPGGSGGRVNASEIWTLDPPCLFYNLFACSNARYTTPQYMGGIYIFAKSSGLITVGSTKSGAMQAFADYYKPLGQKETFGAAFASWFAKQAPYSLYNRQWHYGMTLLGDPTLRIGVPAAVTAYGKGCPGSFGSTAVTTVLPKNLQKTFGNSFGYHLVGLGNHRYQQVFGTAQVPPAFTASAIAFRHDEKYVKSEQAYWAELTLALGWGPNPPDKLSSSFKANTGAMTRVLRRKKVSFPYWTTVNTSPSNFLITIPLDAPFTYTAQAGRYLVLDAIKSNSSKGTGYSYLYLDSFSNQAATVAGRVISNTISSPTGTIHTGYGLVVGFVPGTGGGIVPSLGHLGHPGLGADLQLELTQARSNSALWVGIGLSDKTWQGFALPFDLTGIGAGGCTLLTGLDLVVAARSNGQGGCTLPLRLPMGPNLHNTNLYMQALVLDPGANQAGLAWTNGLKLAIGR